jgi:AraC family transcriptional regulator
MDIRVHYVLGFMEKNLERNILLSELASLISLSNSRFRHLFSVEMGVSPKQYLCNLRLAQARALLEVSPLTIDQIALKVGWKERSHFERRFKRLLGITPAQYRIRERFKSLN